MEAVAIAGQVRAQIKSDHECAAQFSLNGRVSGRILSGKQLFESGLLSANQPREST